MASLRAVLAVAVLLLLAPAPTVAGTIPRPATASLPSAVAGDEPLVTVGALRFRSSGYTLRTLRRDQMPWYRWTPVSLVDTGPHDASGVRMFSYNGTLVNHPVHQAQYAIQLLYSYFLTGDRAYVDRAIANAQRMIDTSTTARGGMYFVYPFDFARHDNKADMMVAPWYSAMAEGLGLTVFSLLFEVTNDAVWRTAADATFATFLNPRVADQPWTVLVDADGYYWLELYPKDVPDYTLNGHIHATEGLFDYYRLTQNPDALALASGALTTVVHLLPSFRTVGWISRYCLAHPSRNPDYHYFHVGQLLQLYTATGKAVFAEWSDRLAADYPNPAVSGTVVFARGTYTGYRFDATGRIIGSKAYTLPRASSAPANARKRIATRSGLWLHITAGVWADYWIQESRSAFIRGTILPVRYDPVRRVVFLPGTWTGYKFDARGTVIASRVGGIISPSTASASTRAIINGRPYLLITNGMWAGYWVGESASIYFAPGG